MASTLARLRYTPLSDLLRGRATGRLDWRGFVDAADLPPEIKSLIEALLRGTRLRRADKVDIAIELIDHFSDGVLEGATSAELIESFGDAGQTACLMRRAKIRGQLITWSFFWCSRAIAAIVVVCYTGLAIYYHLRHPSPKADYLLEMNQQVQQTPPSERAWPIYQSTLISLRGRRWDPLLDFSPDGKHWPQIAQWIDAHEAGIESLRRASNLPVLGFTFGDSDAGAVGVVLPQLRDIRLLADVVAFDAKLARQQGDGLRVEQDIVALANLAAQTSRYAQLQISEVIALGLLMRSYNELDRTLTQTPQLLDDAALVRLAHRLAAPRTASDLISFRGEKLLFQSVLQRNFTEDAAPDGRLTPAGWASYRANFAHSTQPIEQFLTDPALGTFLEPPSMLLIGSKRQLLDEYQRVMEMNLAMTHQPLREADTNAPYEEQVAVAASGVLRVRYAPLLPLFPMLQRSAQLAETTLGRRDGLLVGVALEQYHRRHQCYPDALAQLAPDLLLEVPADRITGDALKYRLINGKPLVYSVGVDRVDDGGRPPMRDGRPVPSDAAQWGDVANIVSGDWVVYPQPQSPPEKEPEN
jgi:hypothetical protein